MVVYLVNDYPPSTGIGRYVFELFKKIRNLTDIELIHISYSKRAAFRIPKSVKIINFPIPHLPLKKTLTWYFYFPLIIRKILKNSRSKSVFHFTHQYMGISCKFLPRSVITVHDIFIITYHSPHNVLVHKLLEKSVYYSHKAMCTIAISKFTKEEIEKTFPNVRWNIKIIPYGIDHKLFKRRKKKRSRKILNLPLSSYIVLHVGSEQKRKNIPTLIKTFKLLSNDIDNLLLLRIGEKTSEIETLIKRLKLEDKILYIPFVDERMITYYYSAADVLVFPSVYEGFGFPLLEAMACGCPIVTNNSTAIPEVVGNAAITVKNPYSPKEYSNAVKEILRNKKLRKKLIRNGLRRASKFSWKRVAKMTRRVYENI